MESEPGPGDSRQGERSRAAGSRAPALPARPTSDELFRHVVESSTGFAIFAVDPVGMVISWNVGAQRMMGYSEEEMLGHDGDVIFTPEDRAQGAPERERQIATATGRAEDERWHRRKDGSRFWGSGLLMPLREGTPGFMKIMRDHTDAHRAQDELRESEARFRMLATNIPQLVFRTLASGQRTWGSPQWEIFTGLSDQASREFGWLEAIHPDDRDRTIAAWAEAQQTGEYYIEHRVRRVTDGEYRWHQTRAAPIEGGDPKTTEWVGTSADIHELRGLQDRQQVLLAELQHRTRNLLAVVQAIARQTLRSNPTPEGFAEVFESRLRALSRVQGLLSQADHQLIDLGAIIKGELAAHGGEAPDKVVAAGPSVTLPAPSGQAMALAIHELATNAQKHGAIRQPSGKLSVTWRIEQHEGQPLAVVDWRETGVEITAPRRRGYGSELIERALPYQLNARTRLEFAEDGVRCRIAVPVQAPEERPSDG
jgi:PAS domain S-box-containing protein